MVAGPPVGATPRAATETDLAVALDRGDWLKPSIRLWTLRRAEGVVVAVAVTASGSAFAFVSGGTSLGAAVTIGVGLLSVVGLIALRNRVKAWRYREREDDLLVSRGLLFQRLSVVPYGRMQFVDVTAGPFERVFHIATLRMHTAAAASDARIPGLETEEAARLRDRLAALGESMAAGL